MSTPTIPAALLEALGGLRDDDPPVLVRRLVTSRNTGGPMCLAMHPGVTDGWAGLRPLDHILVEQSMPALLRALARQYGAELEPGEVPQWFEGLSGEWWLHCSDKSTHGFVFPNTSLKSGSVPRWSVVPALTVGMTRIESLAAVIAWLVSR